MKPRIAIDGPAGAGKSTVARAVAKRLGLAYLDTGAMYRAITVAGLRRKIDFQDQQALAVLAAQADLDVQYNDEGQNILFLDGENVSETIREPQVSRHVSLVARCPGVRAVMVQKQKEIGQRGGVVMDGRDIGTNVMTEAEYKFYLTASLAERARRRLAELLEKGQSLTLEQMKEEIAARDKIDSERECSPLRPADDAIHIDSTELTIDEVVALIVETVTR
ncbi:MAG TPA: (d)CMP kinase [Oscillospiraceae bacterium]|nr:(d)CMP kinase [Oscillospiraceae bacterium]